MTPRKLTPAEALEYVRAYHVGGVANWAEVMDRDPEECIAALEEAMAQKPPAVVDMNVCEIDHLFLNTGVLYRFRRAEGCDACASYGKRSDKPAAPVPSDEEIVSAIESADSTRTAEAVGHLTEAVALLARRIGVQGVPQ